MAAMVPGFICQQQYPHKTEGINPVLCPILRSRETFPRLLNRLLTYGSEIRLSMFSQLGKENEIIMTGLDKTKFLLGTREGPRLLCRLRPFRGEENETRVLLAGKKVGNGSHR